MSRFVVVLETDEADRCHICAELGENSRFLIESSTYNSQSYFLPVTSTRVLRRCCLPLSDLTSTTAILVDAWALVIAATLVDSLTRFNAAFLVNAWTLVIASHAIDSSKIDAKSIAKAMRK